MSSDRGPLERRLTDDGFVLSHTQISDRPVTVARRADFRWRYLGRMHFFVIVFHQTPADVAKAQSMASDALDYAIHHKGGLPRGLQTGTITFPVVIAPNPSSDLVQWAEHEPAGRWAAMLLPVLADPVERQVYWFSGRLSKGYHFQREMHDVIARLIAPAVRSSVGGREPPTRGASFSGRFHDQPPSELDQPSVTVRQAVSESFSSAQELARAFGAPVLEPTWWPQDTGELSYRLTQTSGGGHYQIGSTRHDGIPICIVGQLEAGLAGRTPRDWLDGEWSEPPELAHVRGLIGKVGTPTRLQAAIYDQALQIQLIGYDTETEILTAARSLRRAE